MILILQDLFYYLLIFIFHYWKQLLPFSTVDAKDFSIVIYIAHYFCNLLYKICIETAMDTISIVNLSPIDLYFQKCLSKLYIKSCYTNSVYCFYAKHAIGRLLLVYGF